jgi:hypothetical protein
VTCVDEPRDGMAPKADTERLVDAQDSVLDFSQAQQGLARIQALPHAGSVAMLAESTAELRSCGRMGRASCGCLGIGGLSAAYSRKKGLH